MRRPELCLLVAPLLGLALAASCRAELECSPGSLSCECAADNACNEGLVCVDEVCITDDSSEEGGETSPTSSESSDASSSSGGDGDGDGDGDATGDGDGDGTGDGDGDTTGDGDGDTTGDGDGDGDGDACDTGFTCQPAIPNGWQGPVAMSDLVTESCPSDWPQMVHDSLGSDPDFGTWECDCTCGDALGVGCADEIGLQSTSSCLNNPFFNPEEYITLGSCIAKASSGVASATNVKIWGLSTDLTGASCPPTLNQTAAQPEFTANMRTCGTSFDSCEGDGYCEPPTSGEFDRVCIYNSGEVNCPAERFTEQLIGYDDIDDQRMCSECTCSAPEGSCDTTVYFSDLSCAGSGSALLVGSGGPTDCVSNASADYIEAGPADSSNVTCTASQSTAVGEVTATGPTTICCEPL